MNKLSDFPVGTVVLATPKDNDFAHEFMGTVIGHKDDKYAQVRDQDNNVFDCEPDQLSTREDGECCGNCDCHGA